MLARFLGKLTGEAVRGLARNLFPGFWERDISAGQAMRELQEAGLGYRRQDFLNDFRAGREGYNRSISVRFVRENNVPSERILEGKYHGVPDRYSFVFKASGIDRDTGESTDRYFFMHRNSLDTRGSMQQDALDWFSQQGGDYNVEVEDINLVEGYINPVWEGGE